MKSSIYYYTTVLALVSVKLNNHSAHAEAEPEPYRRRVRPDQSENRGARVRPNQSENRAAPSQWAGVKSRSGPKQCPAHCTCQHTTVRCSHSDIYRIPQDIPIETTKLYLSGSQIKHLSKGDLSRLPNLRSLSLANTGLTEIYPGAFQDSKHLERLDLSYNKLTRLDVAALGGLTNLKVFQVNHNNLECLAPVVKYFRNLEVLSLHNNKLKRLIPDMMDNMPNLRSLRLDNNNFHCSCQIDWLASFLRRKPDLGLGTICATPQRLTRRPISTLLPFQLTCTKEERNPTPSSYQCSGLTKCPEMCKCANGVVDCRNLGLRTIPENLPADTIELRLEKNMIQEIPPFAFNTAPILRRIDLSSNHINKLSSNSFRQNKYLTTIILYGNNINQLPEGIFSGLKALQMILLNKNNISCVQADAFVDQGSLLLLSLYDNSIKSLSPSIFSPLKNILTMHLGSNPWTCDCNLAWLSEYLQANAVESSGASCFLPLRLRKKRITSMHPDKFLCKGDTRPDPSANNVQWSDTCEPIETCPEKCSCSGYRVDCSGLGLTSLPEDIPGHTEELYLEKNQLRDLGPTSICKFLPNLRKISLKNNVIEKLKDGAFDDCENVEELNLSNNDIAVISNNSLKGLFMLKSLDMSGNLVVCLEKGSFDDMRSLEEMKMNTEYLDCSCSTAWLAKWIRDKGIKQTRFVCSADARSCSESESSKGCSTATNCPLGCTCLNYVVRCSRLGLSSIPEHLPRLTKELYLDHNNISVLNANRLTRLNRLNLLDLSNNQLTYLEKNSFPYLPKVKTLILSYNRIQCMQDGSLKGLPSMKVLSLHDNNLAGLKRTAFGNLDQISNIAVSGNPLHCDCRISWFSKWIKETEVESGTALCSTPEYLQDKAVLATPPYFLICTGDPDDPIQSRCDPCFKTPCRNGGLCISDPYGGLPSSNSILPIEDRFRCECSSSFHGDRCQHGVNACFGNPCRNGATCKILEAGRFACHCPAGWAGRRCQRNINDCQNHRCQNDALCVDKIGGYECRCQEGYRGTFCQIRIAACQRPDVNCHNEGKCVEDASPDGWHCECKEGFIGANCSVSTDKCRDHMCQNGAKCVNGINDYSCSCPAPYSGRYCEIEPEVGMLFQQTSPCSQHDCQHGVCFQPPGVNDYICKCSSGYSGKRCEYLTSIQLMGPSAHIELDPLFTARPINLTIVIQTKEAAGVLLYHGDEAHLAVELFHGRIRVSLDVGNHPVSTMFSYAVLNDDLPHAVELLLTGKNLTLAIDGGLARSIVNEGPRNRLEVSRPTFIGGLPRDVGEAALSRWHLRNSTSLGGCLKEFYIDGKLLDFLQAAHRRPGVVAGCGKRHLGTNSDVIMPQALSLKKEGRENRKGKGRKRKKKPKSKACRKSKCRDQGTKRCSSVKGSGDYKCKCKKGYDGRYCEKAPTCRKAKQRSFMEENNCRSKKKMTVTSCEGECHGKTCCKPKKTKKRKVGMICNDGTRYVKMVTIVKRCSCGRDSTCAKRTLWTKP